MIPRRASMPSPSQRPHPLSSRCTLPSQRQASPSWSRPSGQRRASTATRRRERARRPTFWASFSGSLQLDVVHVPFSSGGQAIGSTLTGHTPISFGALPPAVQHVKQGKLRALAITSTAPSDALVGVPTIAQAGYPDFAADIWTAVLVPAGTPKDIVALLQREIARLV